MNLAGIPYKFAQPWAASASGGYSTDPVPANASGGHAGQDVGFPPLTATPPAAGGIPPDIADFNGFGFYATSWARWQQAGGPIEYDATFSANVGGYPNGARLQSSVSPNVVWRNTADNNTANPDTSGEFWVNDFASDQVYDGWQLLPSGLIIQWLSADLLDSTTSTLNFPVAFPTLCFVVIGSVGSSIALATNSVGVGAQAISAEQFDASVATPLSSETGCFFIAIGN